MKVTATTSTIPARGRFVALMLLALFALPSSSLMAQDRLFVPFAGKQQALNAEQLRKFHTFEQQETSGRIELVRIDDLLPAFRRGKLVINLPGRDEEFIAEQADEEYHPPDTYLWRGRLLSGKGSVVLVQSPGEVTGVIDLEGGQWYKIEPLGDGLHALITVDMSRFPMGDDTPPDADEDDGERQDKSPQPALQKTGSSNVTIEVLVLYTDDAYGAVGNIFNTAITAVNQARTAYQNSGISQLNIDRIRTMSLINFQETSDHESTVNSLASNSEANNLRNTWSADVVVLLTDGDYPGALGRARAIGPSNSYAYAIVEAEHATGRFTFAHEIGHLQGAHHQQCSIHDRACDDASGSAHGYGWAIGGGDYNWTIMHALGRPGNRIQRFSNPSVSYNGIATGTSNNNVAQKLRNTASTMANFRTPPPLSSVSISGPDYLAAGQQGTWTAYASGGRKPYDYRWSKMQHCDNNAPLGIRAVPCGVWGQAGVGRSFTSSFNSSHRLKLTVTDDGRRIPMTVYKEVLVTEYGSGGLSASYEQTAGEALQNSSLTALPETYALASNYPNPFNPSTEIRFTLPEASAVSLIVYDVMGREAERLLDKTLGAGYHEARWDATGLPSGVYLYRIEAGSFAQTRHMTLLK